MNEERDEGQAAVELALVLPLVVVLLLALVQVTLVARDQVLVVHAARAGARQAAVDDDAREVRRAVANAGGLKSERLEVDTTRVGPDVVTRVHFRAPTDVALIGPLLPDVNLEGSASMRSEMSPSATIREGATTSSAGTKAVGGEETSGSPAVGFADPGPRPVNG